MRRFRPEPAYTHGSPTRIGILLVNLGTPEAPTAAALRPYLKQFLSDPRVVEIPRLLWWPILNGIILTTRPPKSAAKYASIWTDEGSPLAVLTARQTKLVSGQLGEAGHPGLHLAWAMRYGQPAIGATLDAMKAAGCTRILVQPLYPQYAASTTASVHDDVCRWLLRTRNQPEIRLARGFCDDPGYIAALAASIRQHWQTHGRGDKLVMSFHGLPQRSLELGDPYHCECHKTARLLAEALGLAPDDYLVSFQSRFGRAKWLQPYTQPSLVAMPAAGVRRVDVVCPGFVADCLETREEIAMECKAAFLAAGGDVFHYIDCLNERPDWIAALSRRLSGQIGDWLAEPAASPADRTRSAALARQAGAAD